MIPIAKYQKKPIVVDAELFKLGMEDGYGCYKLSFSDKHSASDGGFIGFYHKDGAVPKTNRKPAIQTLEGWYVVEVGNHYIVTGIKGERYPVEVDIFHELYDLVENDDLEKA